MSRLSLLSSLLRQLTVRRLGKSASSRRRVGLTRRSFRPNLEWLETRLAPSTYYVDNTNPNCSDTGPGSQSQPFCHIQTGANRAVAGDTVQVVAGSYSEMVTVNNSGTSSAPIVFTANAGVTVTGRTDGFSITGLNWITIRGFTINHTSSYGIAVYSSSHITLDGNDVSYAGQPQSGLTAEGIDLNGTNNSTVSRNTTHNNSSDGILLEGGSTGNDVVANNSYGNAKVYIRDANGIQLYGASGNTVERNLSHDNEDTGINVYFGSSNNVFFDNVTYNGGDHGFDFNNSSGNVVIDSSVYHNTTSGINVEGSSTNTTIANNIAVDNAVNSPRGVGNIRVDAAASSGTTLDYDLVNQDDSTQPMFEWQGTAYYTLAAFQQASGQEPHCIQANPLWVSPSTGNFHLQEGSPAIDSANSGVPHQPTYDADGNPRVDDPNTPNTGVGPRTYDDRGAYEYQPSGGAISGQVFQDTNGNGLKDTGEPPLSGWTVFLDTNNNGVPDPGEPSTTTDAAGNYAFSSLAAGTYHVREVLQSGWTRTTANPDVTLGSGGSATNVNFGDFQNISINGQVFQDTNGNGVKDTGEPGLSSWTVQLQNGGGSVLASATTDSNGNYSFTNVGPGTYQVREVVQSGWSQTTTNPATFSASSGSNVANVTFGDFQYITISGQVFQDTNGNGVKDAGEPGLSSWTVQLQNGGGSVLASATTDSSGNYSFTNVGPGTYRIREVVQSGWTQTTTNPAAFSASSGSNVANVTFGDFQYITISGQVFQDTNGNGVKDTGEPGLSSWTVQLQNGSGTVVASASTGSNGNYSFTNVGPGTYQVREVVQSGWTQTTANPAAFSASSGSNVANVAFGDFQYIAISGQVFQDTNGNGTKDTGEPGLSSWTVQLQNGGGTVLASANTDSNGNYSFTNVGPGTYQVREVLQSGWTQTTTNPAAFSASSGSNVANVAFGDFQYITISGQVFQDTNGNGVKDTGEPGLSSWTVQLQNGGGSVLASATTDSSGNYSFTNVGPGTYRIREAAQSGWTQTTTNPAAFSASSGSNVANVTFGDFQYIAISGQVFQDTNGNGVKDTGEPGLSSWTVQLQNGGGSVLATATTDSNGNYSFTNVGPGTYQIREAAQSGWSQTTANPAAFSASSGSNVANVTFGDFQNISISGLVFLDNNQNGVQDPGEPGLSGWTVQLQNGSGSVLASTATDANGNYSLSDLGAGTYYVRQVLQAGWIQTTANPAAITASSGSNVSNVRFGNFQNPGISGQVFQDTNGNGAKDSGEPGLSGWTVFLDANNNGVLDPGESSTSSDSNGNYSFLNLSAGTYHVRQVLPAGWTQTSANPDVTLSSSGGVVSNVSFGDFQNISISGQAFQDTNGNGVKDSGEAGLSSWTVQLQNGGGAVLASATTDSNGNYSFTNVGPGTYQVREVVQSGWTQTTANPATIAASSGSNVANVNFGDFQNISIGGQVFQDTNGNGVKDTGEPGLSSWTVQLQNGSGTVLASASTDSNGNYSFSNLGPGTYQVREVLQSGWTQTTANPAAFSASSGSNVTGTTFGDFQNISISGQVFQDTNGNGVKDTGEPGLSSWTVQLQNGSGTLLASASTDSNGNYSFTNLGPGTYQVREVLQSGWTQTTANPAAATARSGSNISNGNFGDFQNISISGQVFLDANDNGVKDPGEAGLLGWTVFLDTNHNGVLDPGEPNTTTDVNGNYSFTNLGPGTYYVREVMQTGFTQTTPNPAPIIASSGSNVANVLFGNFLGAVPLMAAGHSSTISDPPGSDPLRTGHLSLLVDDAHGLFTADELARVHNAIATLAPFGTTVTQVSAADNSAADIRLEISMRGPCGGFADGVLGCEIPPGEIIIIQGWNWYAGADPRAIGPNQYDFQTIVTHELGHALGLGHSPDPSSVMYATLAPGVARRALTVHDLNLPDLRGGSAGPHGLSVTTPSTGGGHPSSAAGPDAEIRAGSAGMYGRQNSTGTSLRSTPDSYDLIFMHSESAWSPASAWGAGIRFDPADKVDVLLWGEPALGEQGGRGAANVDDEVPQAKGFFVLPARLKDLRPAVDQLFGQSEEDGLFATSGSLLQ